MSEPPKLDTADAVLEWAYWAIDGYSTEVNELEKPTAAYLARAVRTLRACEGRRDSLEKLCYKQKMRDACGPAEVLSALLAEAARER